MRCLAVWETHAGCIFAEHAILARNENFTLHQSLQIKNQNMTTAIANIEQQSSVEFSAFGSMGHFETAQRMAKLLSSSSIVPESYRGEGRVGDCTIALEIANRIGASVLAVMQNLHIVHGRPAWSAQFLISCLNASRRFSPLRYRITGDRSNDTWGCVAWATDRAGEVLESPEVTIAMSKAEGWFQRNGSKWKTIPELMLRYRAATFFTRLYAPELTMGIQTDDEVIDVKSEVFVSSPPDAKRLFQAATPVIQAPPVEQAIIEKVKEKSKKPSPPVEETRRQLYVRILTEGGVSFDDARSYIGTKNISKDADSWASWDEVPSVVFEALNDVTLATIKTFVARKA